MCLSGRGNATKKKDNGAEFISVTSSHICEKNPIVRSRDAIASVGQVLFVISAILWAR